MEKIKNTDYKSALYAFAVSAVLLVAVQVFPAQLTTLLFPAAVVLIPFIMAYAVVRSGYIAGVAAAVLCYAAGSAINFPLSLLLAAMCLPLAVASGYVIRKKIRLRHSIMATCGAALLGVVLAIGVLLWLTGLGPIDFAGAQLAKSMNLQDEATVRSIYQIVRYPDIFTGAVTQAAVDATPVAKAMTFILDQFKQALNYYLVSAIGVFSLFMGLLGYLVPRAVLKKHQTEVIGIPAFSDFTLPKRFWLAYLLSLLVALIGSNSGWPGFNILENTVYSLYGFVLMIQGLSFLDYLYKKRKMSQGGRVALHAVAILLSAFILGSLLIWVGLFENIMKMRSRLETKGGTVL